MSFLDAIREGVDKAGQAEQACQEVADVFRQINEEIKDYGGGSLQLCKGVSAFGAASSVMQRFGNPHQESEFLDADKLIIVFSDNKGGKSQCDVADWRQSVKGYPCIVKYEGEEVFCFSSDELSEAFKGLFSSTSFGKKLKKLIPDSAPKDRP